MATKLTHPNEWKQFLIMCEAKDFDNLMFGYYRELFFGGPKTKEEHVPKLGNQKPINVTKPDGTTEIHQGRNKLAAKLGIQPGYISQYNGKVFKRGKLKGWRFDVMPKPIPVYALYKDDKLLGIGTAEELSEAHGIATSTIEFYSHQKTRPKITRHALLIDWEYPELGVEE